MTNERFEELKKISDDIKLLKAKIVTTKKILGREKYMLAGEGNVIVSIENKGDTADDFFAIRQMLSKKLEREEKLLQKQEKYFESL